MPAARRSRRPRRRPPRPIDPYGVAKARAEAVVRGAPFPTTAFRPSVVLGPGDDASLTLFRAAQTGLGFRVAGDPQRLSFVDVRDRRGQQLGRGALAGLAGGAIPLAFGLCMQIYGHWCGGLALMPGCTTVCTAGGLLAGLWIAWAARRQPSPLAFVGAAGATALLVGTMGCACAGTGGVAGLSGGLLLPVVAARLQAAFAHA